VILNENENPEFLTDFFNEFGPEINAGKHKSCGA
jgi:hypothetical protein